MDSVETGVNEKLLFPILPGLVDTSLNLLQAAPSAREDYKLLTECVNFLTKLVGTFPKQMGEKISASLPILWGVLTKNAGNHITEVVNNPDYADEEGRDSDGGEMGFGTLVQAVFEFIQSLTERKKFKAMIRKVLPDVVYYLITYLSIPEYQVSEIVFYNQINLILNTVFHLILETRETCCVLER